MAKNIQEVFINMLLVAKDIDEIGRKAIADKCPPKCSKILLKYHKEPKRSDDERK